MWKVVCLVCVACLFADVSSEPQSAAASSAAASSAATTSAVASSAAASSAAASSAAASSAAASSAAATSATSTSATASSASASSATSSITPQICTGPNEIYDRCPATCPAQRCGVDPAVVLCAATTKCKPGCRCIDNYVRNENNQCIPKDRCPKSGCNGDPNAIPGCGINCGRTCDTYNKGPQSCIQVCYANACDCITNYVFDDSQKKCVLPQDCSCKGDPNATPGCGVNCGKTCTTYNSSQPIFCSAICDENGCDCREGFVFDDSQKKCVPPQECTKTGCGGDPNARPGCGINCGKTCSTYNKGPVVCTLACMEGGCDCNDGYVFDPKVNKCVLPKYCTPTRPIEDRCGQRCPCRRG